MVMSLS